MLDTSTAACGALQAQLPGAHELPENAITRRTLESKQRPVTRTGVLQLAAQQALTISGQLRQDLNEQLTAQRALTPSCRGREPQF